MTGVTVRRLSGDERGDEAQGVTVNVAPGGLLIEAGGTDAVTGDQVEFRMTHPDERDRVIAGEATVVRHGEGLIALAVSEASAEARAALGALVVARSRAMLHRRDAGQGGASGP